MKTTLPLLPVLLATFLLLTSSLLPSPVQAQETERLEIQNPQTALISGFRDKWNTPQPGKLLFDAVHRRLLVRFPDAAEKLAEKLREGYRIKKAEILLPFDRTDFGRGLYELRTSFGGQKLYSERKPRWHAVAWALKRPWSAHPELGPTYNASIRGAGYWEKFGAQETGQDRFKHRFGPVEVSYFQAWDKPDPVLEEQELPEASPLQAQEEGPEIELEEKTIDPARLDVTPALTDTSFGKTPGERLRRLSDCGFLLRKWETYDWRYRVGGQGAYEWQVAVGGGAIHIQPPRLVVTLERAKGAAPDIDLPPATNVAERAEKLKKRENGGEPTAVMPQGKELQELIDANQLTRPDGMPDWQWKRVQELDDLGGGYRMPKTAEGYAKWIDGMLNDPPRYWNGWDVPDRLLTYYLYRDALPAPVAEHYFQNYWDAWLMCRRPTDQMAHPQAVELRHDGENVYYKRTGDWRGNASFYRDGYCYRMSTMNFNHTSAMGALLAGDFTGCERAVRDGRHGLEHWPLRTWCWYDGSTQESIDHYYFAITLSGQKMFADFGPRHLDRMMGKSILAKSVGEITAAYHPALRHFIASSQRTGTQHALLTQEGLHHIVHTLSREGALHDLDNNEVPDDVPVIGRNVPPGRVAQQTATGPWAPEWVANMVDEKPLPFSMTCGYKEWGHHARNRLWRRTYLDENYGLASTDLHWGVVQVLGQWRRNADQPVSRIQEMGTFMIRCGINRTRLVNSHSGWMPSQGNLAAFQHKNRMLAVGSPYRLGGKKQVKSLQTTVGFFNYQDPPTWEIYVDGEPVEELPFTAQHGRRIAIRDGATYIGLVPLPGGPLANTDRVVLEPGTEQTGYPDKVKLTPALVIDSYSYLPEQPEEKTPEEAIDALIEKEKKSTGTPGPDWKTLDHAYSGFAVEMANAGDYESFDAFQQHLREANITTRWEAEKKTVHVSWQSDGTSMEAGVRTDYEKGKSSPRCWAYRRVDGEWPYLPEGLDRDTTLTRQGSTGRLEKNGATLRGEPGRMAFLQTEPVSGTFCGWNPLPEMTLFRMTTPGGVRVEADGRVGLARVIVRPSQNRIWIDHALKTAQKKRGDRATALLVFGLDGQPTVVRNGRRIFPTPAARPPVVKRREVDGEEAYVVPLSEEIGPTDLRKVPDRYRRTRDILGMIEAGEQPDVAGTVVQDWHVIGPFPNEEKKGFATAYPPEKEVDLDATYEGAGGRKLVWKRTQSPDQPALGKGSINLKKLIDPNRNVCAYAYTEIDSDRERDATLYVGSDDTITVWLNGEKVLSREVYRGAALDQDQTPIHLKKGTNRVLVKCCQTYGGWEFYLRLGDAYGLPLQDAQK